MKLKKQELIKAQQMQEEIAEHCMPILDELAHKYFPNKDGEWIGELLLSNYMTKGIATRYFYRKVKNNPYVDDFSTK